MARDLPDNKVPQAAKPPSCPSCTLPFRFSSDEYRRYGCVDHCRISAALVNITNHGMVKKERDAATIPCRTRDTLSVMMSFYGTHLGFVGLHQLGVRTRRVARARETDLAMMGVANHVTSFRPKSIAYVYEFIHAYGASEPHGRMWEWSMSKCGKCAIQYEYRTKQRVNRPRDKRAKQELLRTTTLELCRASIPVGYCSEPRVGMKKQGRRPLSTGEMASARGMMLRLTGLHIKQDQDDIRVHQKKRGIYFQSIPSIVQLLSRF